MMRDYEKEVERYSLEEEMKMMEDLEEIFQEASIAIQGKIKKFLSRSDANETHVQNQLDIQKARQVEIAAIIALLQTKEFETIDEFLHTSYEVGFTGTLYSLHKQGIPLLFPIDQKQVVNAMTRSSKLVKDLRSTVEMNSKVLQSAVRTELAKGIAMGSSYADIARGIDRKMNTGMKVAMRIARTEGARINQESKFDAAKKAKEAGADLVKQWDSTLDGRTRPTHRKLDGQIRELDEPFEVDGKTAQHPCGFGIASEDINCRCIMLTRARWALEDEEQNSFTKNVEGEIVEFENVKDYEDFKERFYNTGENPKKKKPEKPEKVTKATNPPVNKPNAETSKVKVSNTESSKNVSTLRVKKSVDKDAVVTNFKESLKNGEVVLKVRNGLQNHHIRGTKGYEDYSNSLKNNAEPPSYFLDSYNVEKIEEMIKAKSGTGILSVKNDGSVREFVDFDEPIGYYFDKDDNDYKLTNRGQIKYSNKGTHLIPVKPVRMEDK